MVGVDVRRDRRRAVAALLGAAATIVALALGGTVASGTATRGAASAGPATKVVGWSPFDAAGRVRRALRVTPLGRGDCAPGPASEAVVDGLRCTAADTVADPCWRDGPGVKDLVVCVPSPWTRSVATIRVAGLTLRTGVAFGTLDTGHDPPWGIELASGERCLLLQGAHDTIPAQGSGRIAVDYECAPGRLVLLRDLRRGRRWRIGAAERLAGGGYRRVGDVVARRAVYGVLAPPMRRERERARAAVAAAHLRGVLRVRMAFPGLDWANVQTLDGGSTVLHRVGGSWRRVAIGRPACADPRLPARVRGQLFRCG